ncbi:MAG: protein-L-isoaspartate(D-aspartate) O-methyltransferase [Candidatus Omnitrophica bacterium]|nr:protein-L-isoaspartate(D-aspartate) O-methyltransferase [Candidatus Omnitrophota bacterium]
MDFTALRKSMVEDQLSARDIRDKRVLSVFLKVERHKFIPEDLHDNAYADFPLPIGDSQTISQPYIVALMTEKLDLRGGERVLEIGTGSGYQAAILAELSKQVYSIERFPALATKAQATLEALGYQNIKIKVGDGTLGWQEEAPFERIIITAATPQVPEPLFEQLAENGKMILPLGDLGSQILTLVEKKNGQVISQQICGCVFVPLIGKYGYQ